VLLGSKNDAQAAAGIAGRTPGAIDLAGKTRLEDAIDLIGAAKLAVSNDSGLMHVAAAVGTPIVGIYGPTRPERNGPWVPEDETVSRASICECHHFRQCKVERMCLLDIEVDEVLAAVERRFAAAERRRA